MVVQISSGQGPEECQIAVGKLSDAWKKEFLNKVRSEQSTKGKIGIWMSVSYPRKRKCPQRKITGSKSSIAEEKEDRM